MEPIKPIEIVYHYTHKDRQIQEELDLHLKPLLRSGRVRTWSSQNITPGTNRKQEIASRLESASIILFLLSAAFLASEDAYGFEVGRAMDRASRGEVRVIPIILRPVILDNTPFANFQALPRNGIPVTQWANREEAFIEITKEIRKVVDSLQRSRTAEINWEDEGDQLMQSAKYDDALDAYDRALSLNPNNITAHIGKGKALAGLHKPVEALVSYEMALRLNPANVTAHINRGNVFRDLGRFSEALTSYDQALRLNPDNYVLYLEKGQTLYNMERFRETLDTYNHALELAPDSVPAYIGRGRVAIELALYAQALADFNIALRLNPQSTEAYFFIGEVHLKLHDNEPAYEAFLQVVKLDSRYIPAYLEMGKALRHMHREEEALAAYDTAILLDPNDARAYQIKATILHGLGQDDGARIALYQARDRGLNIDNDGTLQMILNAKVTEVAFSQTRIDSVQQFLANAGFDIQPTPSKVGLLARAKKSVWKMWFHKGLYIRILFDSQLDQHTVDSIAHNARIHQCDHALVIINQQPTSSGWGQINILRGEPGSNRFTCLPIDEAQIQKGIAINSEFSVLRQYIKHRLGDGFDPYDEDSAVTGVVNFYGRQLITEELMDDLQAARRSGLFGMQKMGKTSVLKELQLRATFPAAYVYFTIDKKSLGDIYKSVLDGWATSGRLKYPDFKWRSPHTAATSVSQSEFYMATKNLLSYLDTLSNATPLLAIFLDEIDQIVPTEGDTKTQELYVNLMDSLRGLHLETQRLSLLVAGHYPRVARDNYFWGTQKNPMHQIIKEYFLPPLDDDDCTNMILSLGGQVNTQYEKNALDYIIEMSGSHPLLARRICSYARKKLRDAGPITVDIVDEVVREFVRDPQKNAYFGENGLWNELGQPHLWGDEVSKANHQLLLKLAQEDKMSEEELCFGLDQTIAMQAFYVLKERSVISSPDNSGSYRITFGLFKSWIRFRQLGSHVR